MFIFFHREVPLGDACLQKVVNISFSMPLSLLLKAQLFLTTTVKETSSAAFVWYSKILAASTMRVFV